MTIITPLELDSVEASQNQAIFLKKLEAFKAVQAEHIMPPNRSQYSNKTPVRQRIKALLDLDSTWLELSACAGHDLYEQHLPSGSIVCGIGQIHQKHVMVIANNFSVKAGCYFPITIKKHLRAQSIAEKLRMPCVYLVDSGGIFLPKQANLFADENHFGRIFYQQAQLSVQGIPQISVVLGACTAGGAYVPAMSDETIMVDRTSHVFLAGPPLVKAATGEVIDAESLGGARLHCEQSGLADHWVKTEPIALKKCREIIAQLPSTPCDPRRSPQKESRPPRYPAQGLYALIPYDPRMQMDMKQVIAHLVDDSAFEAFKASYGRTLITGFAHLGGYRVGIIANQGVLLSEAAQKATHFIQLACTRNIPLIFLQNITGFMVGKAAEAGGIAKHGAQMVKAVACANVPKFTVIVGGSYGAGNYAMCGRAYEPNFLFSWPNARCAVMGGAQAALVLNAIRPKASSKDQDQQIAAQYEQESQALYASARLWDDGIIDPKDTRQILIQSLQASAHQKIKDSPLGLLRL